MTLAKPNYRFDKRQREIVKKQKQEEKRLKKLARSTTPEADGAAPANEEPSNPPQETL